MGKVGQHRASSRSNKTRAKFPIYISNRIHVVVVLPCGKRKTGQKKVLSSTRNKCGCRQTGDVVRTPFPQPDTGTTDVSIYIRARKPRNVLFSVASLLSSSMRDFSSTRKLTFENINRDVNMPPSPTILTTLTMGQTCGVLVRYSGRFIFYGPGRLFTWYQSSSDARSLVADLKKRRRRRILYYYLFLVVDRRKRVKNEGKGEWSFFYIWPINAHCVFVEPGVKDSRDKSRIALWLLSSLPVHWQSIVIGNKYIYINTHKRTHTHMCLGPGRVTFQNFTLYNKMIF